MIYLDNAATSLHKPKAVADAVYQTLVSGSVGNAARGSNEASLQALRLAVETRSQYPAGYQSACLYPCVKSDRQCQ